MSQLVNVRKKLIFHIWQERKINNEKRIIFKSTNQTSTNQQIIYGGSNKNAQAK